MLYKSEDHLSHAFFIFQLFYIVKLITEATKEQKNKNISNEKQKRNYFSQYFIFQWSRFLLAFKSMIIIGVGSIFVMVPYLAKIFENGQWILIALCMTQGDTVGGAFTTMKMRLIGTLLGKVILAIIERNVSVLYRCNVVICNIFSSP
jgi:UDP-N-acetylglucosamine:LPS N-acetylglucosamine transferase